MADRQSRAQTKILLWCTLRSTSCAFLRAMTNHSKTKVLLEPFANAYYFGTERRSKRNEGLPPSPNATYTDVKTSLENNTPDAEIVFVKDMAYRLPSHEDYQYLPDGYIHTFLIRDPRKAIPSLYSCTIKDKSPGWGYFEPEETGFRELYDLHKYVTETLGQDSVVIDADDLLKRPELMMRKYCDMVGIEYEDGLVNWEHPMKAMAFFGEWASTEWFNTMLKSSGFHKTTAASDTAKPKLDLPQEVHDIIETSIQYYESLYKLRMKLE